jgi:hypothetical protein
MSVRVRSRAPTLRRSSANAAQSAGGVPPFESSQVAGTGGCAWRRACASWRRSGRKGRPLLGCLMRDLSRRPAAVAAKKYVRRRPRQATFM